MKLIAGFVLICFAMETVHGSRSWNLWDYVKKFTDGPTDSYDDRGPIMPRTYANTVRFFVLLVLQAGQE